jgi:hypothetical protein
VGFIAALISLPINIRGRADWVVGKMRITGRSGRLTVAKKLADHGQAHSSTGGDAGKAVTEVMDARASPMFAAARKRRHGF